MTEVKVLSICSLEIESSQNLEVFLQKVTEITDAVDMVLFHLNLSSEVVYRPEIDVAAKSFGVSVWLKEGKQRNLRGSLEPTSSGNFLEEEANLVDDGFKAVLAQVNRRFRGVGSPDKAPSNGSRLELSTGDLKRICRKLGPQGDRAQIKDAAGASWSANLGTPKVTWGSTEPLDLVVLPIMVGLDAVLLRPDSRQRSNLLLRSSLVRGNWVPLIDPDLCDRFWMATKKQRWLRISCRVNLHPSGYVKHLEIISVEEYEAPRSAKGRDLADIT